MHRFSLDLQQAAAWDEKVKDLTFSNGLEGIFKMNKEKIKKVKSTYLQSDSLVVSLLTTAKYCSRVEHTKLGTSLKVNQL